MDKTDRSLIDRALVQLGVIACRQQQNLRIARCVLQQRYLFEPAFIVESDAVIQKDYVGTFALGKHYSFLIAVSLTHKPNSLLTLNQKSQPRADKRVIVDQQHTNRRDGVGLRRW